MNKKILLSLSFLLISLMSYSQIGVNTENPQGLFDIDAQKNDVTSGTPTVLQLGDDVIVTADGSVGIGVTPLSRLDVDAQSANIKIRNLAVAPTIASLNALTTTQTDGNVFTSIYNNRLLSSSVAPAGNVILHDNMNFKSGLVTITSRNACGHTMTATFTYYSGSLNYVSSQTRDITGQMTVIPIPAGSPNSAGYIIKFPNALPCAGDGGGTQFDFTFKIADFTAGGANFQITNNGDANRVYTLAILRL